MRLLHKGGGEMIRLILTIIYTGDDYDGKEQIQSLVAEEQAEGGYLIDWDSTQLKVADLHELADTIQNIANTLKIQAKSTMEVV